MPAKRVQQPLTTDAPASILTFPDTSKRAGKLTLGKDVSGRDISTFLSIEDKMADKV